MGIIYTSEKKLNFLKMPLVALPRLLLVLPRLFSLSPLSAKALIEDLPSVMLRRSFSTSLAICRLPSCNWHSG